MGEPSASASATLGAAWDPLRAAAAARAAALGPPSNAAEDWRYVNLVPLAKPLAAATQPVTGDIVAAHRLDSAAATLVLVDGVYRADLSQISRNPLGSAVDDLASLPTAEAKALSERWIAGLPGLTDPSACWTLANLAGGLRLRARGLIDGAVQVLSFATAGSNGCRLVVEVAKDAGLDLVISHIALGPSRSSIGIEVDLAANAGLRIDELQYGDAGAQLFSLAWLRLERDSRAAWTFAAAGGGLVRNRIEAELLQPGATLAVNGLGIPRADCQIHHCIRVVHAAGATTSAQLFKTIAGAASLASFDGLVTIRAGADGSAAEQRHHSLLLSPKARVDTRPQLDILADDVKAAHGATIGRPDADELFYLRSRGLGEAQALAVLTRGFALAVVALLHNPGARTLAERLIVGTMD